MQTRSTSIANAVKKRDGACIKCGGTEGLESHHITPISENGPDTTENQVALCFRCHDEWHTLEKKISLSFCEWVAIPPVNIAYNILADYFCEKTGSLERFGGFCDLWNLLHNKRIEHLCFEGCDNPRSNFLEYIEDNICT